MKVVTIMENGTPYKGKRIYTIYKSMGSIIHHTFHENTHITKHYIMLYENITLIKYIYIYIGTPL